MDRSWFTRHPAEVAFDLIGRHLTVSRDGQVTTGRIVETEAYAGPNDEASHSGKLTVAKDVMARIPGTVYVYRSYGIHTCMNIVVHEQDEAGGVLIRAIEPIHGVEIMRARRGDVTDIQLGRGPGNVGQALGVLLTDVGEDLFNGNIFSLSIGTSPVDVWESPRIGISKAVDYPWRFFDPTSKCISAHRRGQPTSLGAVKRTLQEYGNPLE